MAHYTQLQLKTFQLSSMHFNSVLSVDSIAFISNTPSDHSPDELCRLIQEHQIWLVSPGLCRLQIIVDQRRLPMPPKEAQISFLQHLADVICKCPLWDTLGLTIKLEDIQHQPLYGGAPNLFFIVEHPNKSSALLSPPHIPTARFSSIECFFCFNPDGPLTLHTDPERPTSNNEGDSATDTDPSDIRKQWEDITHLAQVALYVLVGTKKRYDGIRVSLLDTRPSLLELAPAIWNAHYLKTVTAHAAKFPVVSTILAASSRYQSPSLREKVAKLLHDHDTLDSSSPVSTEVELGVYRSTAEWKLWDLVQTTLKPTIHTNKAKIATRPQPNKLSLEPLQLASHEMEASYNLEDCVPDTTLENIGIDGTSCHDFDPDWVELAWGLQLASYFPSWEKAYETLTSEELQWEFNDVLMDVKDTPAFRRALVGYNPEAALSEEQWNTILSN